MTGLRDDWLAALRAEREGVRPRDDCPAPETIWQAVHLELPADQRGAIVDHISECAACEEAWQLAAELGDRQRPSAGAGPARAALLRPRLYLPIAAALALVVGGIAYVGRQPPSAIERTPLAGELDTGIPEGSVFPRNDFRLRWAAGPAGSRYDVLVTTASLVPIDTRRDLQVPEYRIPEERLTGVPPNTPLLVRVTAHLPDGTTVSSRSIRVMVP